MLTRTNSTRCVTVPSEPTISLYTHGNSGRLGAREKPNLFTCMNTKETPGPDVVLTHHDWQLNFRYTAENLPRILAMQSSMRAWPAEKQRSTVWEKGMSRLEDARRIASGEVSAAEVQAENSVFPSEVIQRAKIKFDPIAFQARVEAMLADLLEREGEATQIGR